MSFFTRWLRSLKFRWIRAWHYLHGYVKIRYEFLPDEKGNPSPSELVWARPLGNNLFQVENVPEDIVDVNLHDVVKCKLVDDQLPVIVEIVRVSGNRTLRVEFRHGAPMQDVADVIRTLQSQNVFYEQSGRWRYMFNIEPTMNYDSIRDSLKSREVQGLLKVVE